MMTTGTTDEVGVPADCDDYTYPQKQERLLAQSLDWPSDVDRVILQLTEANAYLERQLDELKTIVLRHDSKFSAFGRRLYKVELRLVQGDGERGE